MIEPVRIYDNGYRTGAIVKRGRKQIHVVVIYESGIQVRKLPKADERKFKPLEHKGKPYPPKRMARQFLRAGKRLGITKEARRALRGEA